MRPLNFPPFCSELPPAFQEPLEKRRGVQGEDLLTDTVMGDRPLAGYSSLGEEGDAGWVNAVALLCACALPTSEPPEPKPDQENTVFPVLHSRLNPQLWAPSLPF